MNEALMMIKLIALMTTLLAVASFVIYLIGISWLCFQETRPSRAQRKSRRPLSPNSRKSAPGVRRQAGGFSDHLTTQAALDLLASKVQFDDQGRELVRPTLQTSPGVVRGLSCHRVR